MAIANNIEMMDHIRKHRPELIEQVRQQDPRMMYYLQCRYPVWFDPDMFTDITNTNTNTNQENGMAETKSTSTYDTHELAGTVPNTDDEADDGENECVDDLEFLCTMHAPDMSPTQLEKLKKELMKSQRRDGLNEREESVGKEEKVERDAWKTHRSVSPSTLNRIRNSVSGSSRLPASVPPSPCPDIQGIHNIGNSCYLSTALQILLHIGMPYTPASDTLLHTCTVARTHRTLQLWNAWCEFAKQYAQCVQIAKQGARPMPETNALAHAPLNPRAFLALLSTITRERGLDMFQSMMQNDACELYIFLLDEFVTARHYIEKCDNPQLVSQSVARVEATMSGYRSQVTPKMNMKDANTRESLEMLISTGWKSEVRIAEREMCSIWEIFHGYMITVYESRNTGRPAEMVKMEISPHPVLDIYLSGTHATSLENEMVKLEQWENMDDELRFTIEHHPEKPRVNVRKLVRYWKVPEVLVISVHRQMTQSRHRLPHFQQTMQASLSAMDVPETLVLDDLCFVSPHNVSLGECEDALHTYELVATCNHYGTSRFGHYNACVKRDGEWYVCDDETIRKMSWEDVHGQVISRFSKQLFYRRCNVVHETVMM